MQIQDAAKFVQDHYGWISAALLMFGAPLVVKLLRDRQRKLLTDKDPKNDAQGHAAGTAADVIENATRTGKLAQLLDVLFKRKK